VIRKRLNQVAGNGVTSVDLNERQGRPEAAQPHVIGDGAAPAGTESRMGTAGTRDSPIHLLSETKTTSHESNVDRSVPGRAGGGRRPTSVYYNPAAAL
jgi:hypothetical protein